jgi:glutamate synthase domain-containing protein 3
VGTILGSELSLRHGEAGLPEDSIAIHFTGSAGQSFGAFVPRGMTLWVHGETNDYCGKGLSGGKIVVRVPEGAGYDPAENIITGNVRSTARPAARCSFAGVQASASACATAAPQRSSKASATTAAST